MSAHWFRITVSHVRGLTPEQDNHVQSTQSAEAVISIDLDYTELVVNKLADEIRRLARQALENT